MCESYQHTCRAARGDLKLSDENWSFYHRCDGLRPCKTVQQQGQLRRGQTDRAISNRWPDEASMLQPLRRQHDAAAVPRQQLYPVTSLRAENKDVPAVRISSQRLRHQRDQAVHTTAKVDRLRCHPHTQPAAYRDQRPPRTAARTRDSVVASKPRVIRMLASATTISIAPAAGRASDDASTFRPNSAHTATGTNAGAADDNFAAAVGSISEVLTSATACRRHVDNTFAFTPCRAATSDTFAPATRLSA